MKTNTVTPDTTIKELLSVRKEETIAALVRLNKNFAKLKNPLLRGLFAGRITIREACKVAGCEPAAFFNALQGIGFRVEEAAPGAPADSANRAEAFDPLLEADIVELDVRPALESGNDPLQAILKSVEGLRGEQCLKIIATFEPVPLIHLMAKKGFESVVRVTGPREVCTWFRRSGKPEPAPKAVASAPVAEEGDFDEVLASFGTQVQTIDVTGLEMPKPMITILEHLQALPANQALFVYHKKIPVYLLPHLQERGFRYLYKETAEGRVNLLIYKNEYTH